MKEGISKHIIYRISGSDKDGSFDVYRRYNEFNCVRDQLLVKWPGCFIPALPPKKAVGNLDQEFIEERRRALDQFCSQIAKLKHLHYSQEYQVFVRASSGSDIEKALKALPSLSHEALLEKYQKEFSYLSGKEINTDLVVRINTFGQFLKKVKGMLKNFKQMAKNIAKAKKSYQEQLSFPLKILLNIRHLLHLLTP